VISPANAICDRRAFLARSAAIAGGALLSRVARGADRPPVSVPRATSGDSAIEPEWASRLEVRVGNSGADINGENQQAIQAAVDYVARLGGGTVRILKGTYRLRNAVYLQSHVRIIGEGPDTVLIKEPSSLSLLADNSDWYDQEITLAEAKGFEVGDGVCLRATNTSDGGPTVIKRTLIARSGNRFKLDKPLRENLWLDGKAKVETLFPILTGECIEDVVIENLTLDGNKSANTHLDGNYAGCIFIQDCSRFTFRNVEAKNYFGDGFSWQICHDVLVENCHSHDNEDLGFHPGSGSQRPIIRSSVSERNGIGIFFCWGVKYGLAENNKLLDNTQYGVSIGHHDTDNLVVRNTIQRSGINGVLFRPESAPFAGNRNRIEENLITDSGPEDGVAVDVQGPTKDIALVKNTIKESRGPAQRIGIRIGAEAHNVELAGNTISGMSTDIRDMRKA
jgi:hypothetical protein